MLAHECADVPLSTSMPKQILRKNDALNYFTVTATTYELFFRGVSPRAGYGPGSGSMSWLHC